MSVKKEGLSGDSLGGRRFYTDKLLGEFCQFIRCNREGAIVVLTVVHAARKRLGGLLHTDWISQGGFGYGYQAFNALCVPRIEGMEPLQTMQLIEKLSREIVNRDISAEWEVLLARRRYNGRGA